MICMNNMGKDNISGLFCTFAVLIEQVDSGEDSPFNIKVSYGPLLCNAGIQEFLPSISGKRERKYSC